MMGGILTSSHEKVYRPTFDAERSSYSVKYIMEVLKIPENPKKEGV
jgi:hypothetical protein